MELNSIYTGDALDVLRTLPDKSVHCGITSPPYYKLRDYGVAGQIGLENTPEAYIARLASVFREFRRVLRDDGALWVNISDGYAGGGHGSKKGNPKTPHCPPGTDVKTYTSATVKAKDLLGIPWMLAFSMRNEGWYVRQEIIWHKPNAVPESVKDRCAKSHESLFMFTKCARYYFNHDAILEPAKQDGRKDTRMKGSPKYSQASHERWQMHNGQRMRNKRSVWTVPTKPLHEAHFAPYPPDLITPCIQASCPPDGIVLDMFFGSGTTGIVARRLNRNFVGIELNADYIRLAQQRLSRETATLF
jgi:DNA modification methylase